MIDNIELINKYRTFHFKKREELSDLGWKIEVLDIVGVEKPSCTVHIDSNKFMAQLCIWVSGELNFEYLLIEKPEQGHYFHFELSNEDELIQKLLGAYASLMGI